MGANAGHQLAGIEILRFVCAFGVLIWHYDDFFFRGAWDPALGLAVRYAQPLYRPFALFYESGSLAVPFFWVISGFIFYWYYAKSVRSGAVGFKDFVLRRFSRLYPLHFATLIFVAGAQYVYYLSHGVTFVYAWNKPIWFVAHLLFASNWFDRQPTTFNGPIWSVSIEILIYLCFFGVARALGSRAVVAMIAAAAFALAFNFLHTALDEQVFACGMYFFAGGAAQRLSSRRAALPIAGALAITIIAVLCFGHVALDTWGLVLLAASSVIVLTNLGETTLRAPFRRLAFLGNATYSSYLLHFPIQLLAVIVIDGMGVSREIFHSPVALLAYLTVVIGASLLVHRYFEMPAQSAIRTAAKVLARPRQIAGEAS